MTNGSQDMVPASALSGSDWDRQGNWVWDGCRWVCEPDCDPRRPPWLDPPQSPWYPGANGGVSFGADPPRHPVRGHFWWDGRALRIFDGAVWESILSGPIRGVIDGVAAKPGEVGEVQFTRVNGTYPPTFNFTQTISAAVLPPGDWDVQIFIQLVGSFTTGAWMILSPLPLGVLSDMRVVIGGIDPGEGVEFSGSSLLGPVTQANVVVPTLLALQLTTNWIGDSGQPPGNFGCQTFARRTR